ncbi:PREDICTED: uncharacterized protein LOC107344210 isoform X4 [Acropora digitifera]|uniref:uncharacterized protein LOC107344210 isoform X4 n=1 Tax=Acropora digitifera TaxID=70779 RepID=UPI00077A5B0B|nr:PREDICTED: uncharacterized protein LOC107344210 isoform X4 [Acropora digitifera]
MASAKDDNRLSPYRTFLLDLSSKLLIDDLEKLKFACKDAVPYGKMEEVTTGFKFFDLLEQNGKISPQNLTFLENMMKAIRRADLGLEVKQFMTGNEAQQGISWPRDAGLKDDSPSNGPVVRQDEGDEVVPDGVADDLEEKAVKTMCVVMDQPLGVAPIQNNPGSARFSNNAPPASAFRNGPGTGEPTNKGISPAPRENRSFNGGTSSGEGGALAPVARPSPSKPQLREPKGQGTVQYVNFLVFEGYSVQILGGKHYSTPNGEFVELKSGTQYKILLKNSHPYACNVDISIDGYDVGGWIMQGDEQLALERSAYEAKKFTFYRVKKAPKNAGIDPSRPEENGMIKCVFTPEAFVDIQVNISGSSQPLTISFAPSATVGDLKQKIQQQLSKSPDPNQILAQNNKALKNRMPVRRVIESPGNLVLVDVEVDVTVEASTNERFQVKIRPGEAKIIDLMQKIEAKLEVPIKDQKLFHGKTRLSDNPQKDLPEELVYSLNRTVVVIVPDYIEVTVENSASGESVTLKIDKEKRLTDLAQGIPSYRNTADNQEAIFLVDGRELSPVQDTGTLTSLGILSGSRVKLVVRVVFIKVFVTGLPQGRLTVQCNPLDTFQDLLSHVQSRTKLKEIGDATFSTKGRNFNPKEDLDTLQDYGIKHRSTLVFKMEEPRSSKDQLRDQLLKEKEDEEQEEERPVVSVSGRPVRLMSRASIPRDELRNSDVIAQGNSPPASGDDIYDQRPQGAILDNKGDDIFEQLSQGARFDNKDTSYYTAQQFKAFKSLEAYNQMVSGFITCVQEEVIAGKYVVLAKVRHSQRMNDPPIPIWVIASQEGTIISVHCMGCKAGLGETCSHVASVLFYIEAWTRINGKMACTQVKCAWLLPTYVNEVPYARARDINFKSAKRLKEEMDLKIDAVGDNQSEPPAPARNIKTSNMSVRPLDEDEMNAQLKKLNDLTVKPVILSLFKPYSENFISRSQQIVTIPDLYDPSFFNLSYPDLLKQCFEVNLDRLNDSELCAIEADTRKQFKGNLFFRHRAGRIGASVR